MSPPPPTMPVPTMEIVAATYAELSEQDGEQAIDSHALVALRQQRIDDVVFWQRVRFRSRVLRAIEQRKRERHPASWATPFVSQSAD